MGRSSASLFDRDAVNWANKVNWGNKENWGNIKFEYFYKNKSNEYAETGSQVNLRNS